MKTPILLLFALTVVGEAQTRRPEFRPEQTARIEAIRDARIQRARAERAAVLQDARDAGRAQARATRARDRAFMAVWINLTPEVRGMNAAKELAERLSRRPAWKTQNRTQRIAATTAFITNYPAIKAARPQATMNVALGEPSAAFPSAPDMATVLRVVSAKPSEIPALKKAGDPVGLATAVQPLEITEFPQAETPDLFAINRLFNWAKPHGQWMNQMLKDIDVAKAAGDTETYESLTKRYAAWAEQYLREDR